MIARLRALFGKKSFTSELVDLNEATREVIALSLSEFQRGRVVLRTELADDLPRTLGVCIACVRLMTMHRVREYPPHLERESRHLEH